MSHNYNYYDFHKKDEAKMTSAEKQVIEIEAAAEAERIWNKLKTRPLVVKSIVTMLAQQVAKAMPPKAEYGEDV